MIADIANFKKEYMWENYRNARQITDYCNNRFMFNMRSINLDGAGVHELKNKGEFETVFAEIFQKAQKVGLSCIIVKNKEEADTLLFKARRHITKINNMTREFVELQGIKWNLMTVEQARGLEFQTVFAITGRMSENEKYITYTRALDELYVYDVEIELSVMPTNISLDQKVEKKFKRGDARKKREKRSVQDTKVSGFKA